MKTPGKKRSFMRHPFAAFIGLGIFLALFQIIAVITDGEWPKSFVLNGFANVIMYAIVGYGFSFLIGYAGLASLGTAGFVGFGAYFTAFFLKQGMPDIPYFVVIISALTVSVLLGLIVGFISLRIEGIFLAIVTLGISEVFYQLFNSWMDGTGGPNGASIRVYPIFQKVFGMSTGDAKSAMYLFLVAVMVLLMLLTYNLGRSRTGRAMLAMKNSSSAAQAMGISLLKYRLLAFLLSTAYAVFAGILFMSYNRTTLPYNYTIMLSLEILAVVLIGGSRSLLGTFIGSFIVFGSTPILFQNIKVLSDNAWLIKVIIGAIIILVVMFYPGGLAQLAASVRSRLTARLGLRKPAGDTPQAGLQETAVRTVSADPDRTKSAKRREIAAMLSTSPPEAHSQPIDPKHGGSGEYVLRVSDLSMVFGGLKAVDSLSFDVIKGEIFGLIGPNGAGKTTVFNCITQFYKPTSGKLLFRTAQGEDVDLNQLQVHRVITKGIVRTFQNVEVIGELTILENLLIAAHSQYRSSLLAQVLNTRHVRAEEEKIQERAKMILDYCDLLAVKDVPPVGQPYGILKRIELARTLMAGASLIILDEPAAGLNDQETLELTHLIRDIQRDFGMTIFLVEHNMGLVMDLCDHICAISFGRKLAYGTPAEIQRDKRVQEAYLGTNDTRELEAVR